jgi:threonine aldolase
VLAHPFDLVSVALSKGLGAPGGSLLAGPSVLITRAVRARRMLGGAMRQNGILTAAGLYALDHHVARLAEDHVNARLIASRLAGARHVRFDPATVQTNIVIFHLDAAGPDASTVVERARQRGVLVIAFGPRTVRVVTHYDVSRQQCEDAADILASVAEAP